jgi:CubicO group peptidase (beta-lactamase class C family)
VKKRLLLIVLTLTLLLAGCDQPAKSPTPTAEDTETMKAKDTDADVFARFEARLEELGEMLKLPGFSAAVVKDQELVWANGFGYADLENRVAVTPDTPFHLASLTKPFAAAILMQLVEEGLLDLDDPVSEYGVNIESPGVIRVRHLLSMTSEGVPGRGYRYNGDRFGRLSQVIERAAGKSFQELLFERIVEPLGMTNTTPSPGGCAGLEYRSDCERVFGAIARPYTLDYALNVVRGFYYEHFSTAAGLISTVVDLARFDIAMDRNLLVAQETKERMFAPTLSADGAELPYGLGWFSQDYRGTRLIWHYGHWAPSVSSLILKVPDEKLTFIILANTDNLSRPYNLGGGDVLNSIVALAFYKTLVFEPYYGQPVPDVDWEAQQGDMTQLLNQYSDEELRDLLVREYVSYKNLSDSYRATEGLARRIAQKLDRDVDPQVFQAYVGSYVVPAELVWPFSAVAVTSEDGRLYLEIPQGPTLELYPQSETSFFFMADGGDFAEVTFVTDETGAVTRAVFEANGQRSSFERMDP